MGWRWLDGGGWVLGARVGSAEWGPGGAHPSRGRPPHASLAVTVGGGTSYGWCPIVTYHSYDDEVCSEFQLYQLCDCAGPDRRPSEYPLLLLSYWVTPRTAGSSFPFPLHGTAPV